MFFMANYHRSAVANQRICPLSMDRVGETRKASANNGTKLFDARAALKKKKAIKKEIFLIYYFKNTSRAYKISPEKFISSRVPLIPPIIFFSRFVKTSTSEARQKTFASSLWVLRSLFAYAASVAVLSFLFITAVNLRGKFLPSSCFRKSL